MTVLAVFTETKIFPAVQEILVEVVKQHPDITGIELWADNTDRTLPVLVLGNMPPITPANYVKTLSQKQILATPSSMTELHVAINNLLTPPTFPPMAFDVVISLSPDQERRIGDVLVVDIETGGKFGEAIRPSEKTLLCVGINDGRNIYVFGEEALRPGSAGRDQLVRILTKPGRKLVAHNMKFDFPILSVLLDLPVTLYGNLDTMLLHHSINHGAKEHDLENLAVKYLGAPDWKGWAKEYTRKSRDYATIPRDVLYKYNATDVYWTWHLLKYLERVAGTEDRLARVALHEFRMSRLFQDIEANGVGVDLPYLAQLKKEYDAQEIEPKRRLLEITGGNEKFVNSPKQVKEFFASCGYNLPSTDEAWLLRTKMTGEAAEARDLLLELREISKMRGTYVNGVKKRLRGNVVYPTFKVHGTTTGRLSSSDPNIQNIPRDKRLRKIFVPRASGRTMVQVDYSQAELRVMACLSGDTYLQSLFQKGSPDFFDALMPTAFPRDDIAAYAPGVKKDKRAKLKATVYGMAYNRQPPAIAASLNMPVQEAAAIQRNFFKSAPQLYEWREDVKATVLDENRSLISPFGRQYQAEVITSRNEQNVINSALAFLPQSTASDMCAVAAMHVNGRLKSGQYGDTKLTMTVHDAIVADVPNEYVEEVAAMMQAEMENAGRDVFGDVVHFGAEAAWGPSWADAG